MLLGFNVLVAGESNKLVVVFFLILSFLFSQAEEILRDEVQEYVRTHRGKELPGFVSYRTFETIVKKHIELLEEPALKLLRDVKGKCINLWQLCIHDDMFYLL